MNIGIDIRDISLGTRNIIYWQTRSLVELERECGGQFKYHLFWSSGRRRAGNTVACLDGPVQLSEWRLPNRLLYNSWLRVGWPPIELLTGTVDVFHGMAQILPPQRTGKRLLTIYDVIPLRVPSWSQSSYLSVESLRRSALVADHITTISNWSRSGICETLGVDAQKVTVVYPGVAPFFLESAGAKDLDSVRQRCSLDRPYLLHVGELQPRKNLRRLFEAVSSLPKRFQEGFDLVLVGPAGRGYDAAKKDLAQLGPTTRVRFLGPVSEIDLRALYRGARAFVCVSLHEGFGLPALEAMACGAPVLVADAGALPEVVGDAGLLVNPIDVESIAQGLRIILDDQALQRRLASLGKARVRGFTWRKAAARVRALYQQLLS